MIRFTLPSIAMMIFTSIYGVVDGFFVSNFVGAVPFASLNLVMPFIMILSGVGGVIPLIFFFTPNSTELRLGKTRMNFQEVWKTCTNGASEFLSSCASSVVGMLYNLQLMKYIGTDGVAAYGVIMYVNFIFVGIYFGYSMGIAPVIGYHYGAQNHKELRGIFRKTIRMLFIVSTALTVISELASRPLVWIFVGYDAELMKLTVYGFRIYTVAFLFMGFNIFRSGFLTALNNGKVSAVLSTARSLVLELISIYALPRLFGASGLWFVVIASDGICLILTVFAWGRYRSVYHY